MAKSKYIVQHITITETVDVAEPPPPHIKPTFKTLEDWLIAICDSEGPHKPVETIAIGLFESENDRVLFLVGMNKYANHERIEFQPKNMYFLLPDVTYKDLNPEQLRDKLTDQLENFIASKKFEISFLTRSKSIFFSGKKIWSK